MLNPEILICGLLVATYTIFVACECAEGLRGRSFRGPFRGAPWGVALAVGTGLWAANTLSALAHRPAGSFGVELSFALISWVCSVGAASTAMHAALARDISVAKSVPQIAACAFFLLVLHLGGDAVQGRVMDSHLSSGHIGLMVVASLCVAAALVLALSYCSRGTAAISPQRIALVLFLGALLMGQIVMTDDAAEGYGSRGDAAGELPTVVLAFLAGVCAALVLTLARIAARFERRLSGKADQLESSLRVANRDLHDLAYRDPLTRLANRRKFDQKMAAAVAAADGARSRLTLLFIDLDGFKPVNDCYGHASGDLVLRAVSERLRRVAPKGSVIARMGGDEFAMLVRETLNTGEASLLASRVLVTLGTPFDLSGAEVKLSASIGIAFYPDCGGAEKLMACGDAAMYAAKRSGGAAFTFFEPGMGGDIQDQAELMRDLRKAAELRQLELHYQPKVDAESGQVTAVEALLRWNHPVRGMVGPDVFIPLAERLGLIGGIGDWVLDEACRQMSEWQRQGVQMRVAINLSARQLLKPGLSGRIERVLQQHGVAPELLTCEVTESTAMSDTRNAHRALTLIGRLGVRVSIDDFGTGYSSLAYLRQLPATELKIDRSFVSDLDTSDDARAIVQAVIQMAHALDLKVVAEGVETAAQRDILQVLGCDEFQGYLFAKPLPAATVLKWALTERSKPRTFRPSLFLKSLFAPLT